MSKHCCRIAYKNNPSIKKFKEFLVGHINTGFGEGIYSIKHSLICGFNPAYCGVVQSVVTTSK